MAEGRNMSKQKWQNDTDRGRWSIRRIIPVRLRAANSRWRGLQSNSQPRMRSLC